MLEEGITYPKRGDWLERILIGGLLIMFGFLLLPMFIVYGYLLKVLQTTYEGATTPPEFEDWGSLLVRGLLAWLIGIAYALPIIIFTLLMIPLVGFGALQEDPLVFLAGTGVIWFSGVTILGILIGYILPAAYVNYARTNRAGAAFDLGTITSIAFSVEYLTGIILALVVMIVFGILSSLVAITIIGVIAIPFIGFYGYVAAAYIVSNAVRNANTS